MGKQRSDEAAPAGERLTPERIRAIFAEWREDYAARAGTGAGQGVTPLPLPSPSEIAAGRQPQTPPRDAGLDHGRER